MPLSLSKISACYTNEIPERMYTLYSEILALALNLDWMTQISVSVEILLGGGVVDSIVQLYQK